LTRPDDLSDPNQQVLLWIILDIGLAAAHLITNSTDDHAAALFSFVEEEYELVDDPAEPRAAAVGRWLADADDEQIGELATAVLALGADTVVCERCQRDVPSRTAHTRRGRWVGDECCWKK
jgi:hypothetical protein